MAREKVKEEAVVEEQPEETSGKKGKKGKKPKKERVKKGKRGKGEPGEQEEKVRKRPKGKLILAIIIISLIGAAGAFYYFNLFEVKSKVINFFISQDTQYQDAIAAKSNYELLTAELEQRKIELNNQQKQLDEDILKLEEEKKAFNQQKNEENAQGGATTAGSGDGKSVVDVLAGMKASAAAEILNRTTDNGWIADVLKQMDEKTAGKILAAMDVEKAVVITRLMSQ